jgi:hypothetical protein
MPRERRRCAVGVLSAPLARLVGRENGGPSGGDAGAVELLRTSVGRPLTPKGPRRGPRGSGGG